MNLREFTSALIMEDCLRSWPEAAICFTAWKERSHMHKEVALRRFAALPYLSVWKNRAWVTVAAPTGKGLLGDLCQMLLLKEQPHWEDKERSSSLYAFTMCVCALWCQAVHSVPQVFSTKPGLHIEKSSTLSSTLHASFLHPSLSEGTLSARVQLLFWAFPGLWNFERLIFSYIFSEVA